MSAIERAWQKRISWSMLLLPLSALFAAVTVFRRFAFKQGWQKSYRSRLPVLVVGNINVGGSGKTPTVIWLCEQLRARGWQPAVVSRGYGGKAPYYPYPVQRDSATSEVGDEPLLIHLRTQCPVVVAPKRADAVRWLEANTAADVIITDDGLQHYALERDLELVVIDGNRRFGNQCLLPAGPLREPMSRLASVDFLVCNGAEAKQNEHLMRLQPSHLHTMAGEPCELSAFDGKRLLAIAGIGHPQRFFDTLKALDVKVADAHPLADHQALEHAQLTKWAKAYDAVLMTEKDAVKCASWAPDNCFYLPVNAQLDQQLIHDIDVKLRKIQQDRPHGI